MIANYERRCFAAAVRVIEDNDREPKFEGYSAVFDELSVDLGGFREKISPGAFAQSIIEDDIRALFNHDENYVIGRSTNGTLTLSEDEHGLRAVNTLEDTYIDQYLIKKIKRGDITGMSFGFIVPDGGEQWEMDDQEMPIRTLQKVRLWDISPVTYPAYPQTAVGIRSTKDVYEQFLSRQMQEQMLSKDIAAKYQERKAILRKVKIDLLKGI